MNTKLYLAALIACFAIGTAGGVILVDDHPNAQKLVIANLRAQLEENQRATTLMVAPCTRYLALVNATHADERLPHE